MGDHDPKRIFHAGRQEVKVRFVMLLSLACAAGACYWAADLARHYGLAPADGGVLAPFWQRIAWALGVAALGAAFAFGMWLYGRYYVAEIWSLPDSQRMRLRTVTFFGSQMHEIDPAEMKRGRHHAGQLTTYDLNNPLLVKQRVNAPWRGIYLKGRRWPLILDLQGNAEPDDRA